MAAIDVFRAAMRAFTSATRSATAAADGLVDMIVAYHAAAGGEALSPVGEIADVGAAASAGSGGKVTQGNHVHRGVASLAKSGEDPLYGAVQLVEGEGVTLTQDDEAGTVEIAASGGGGWQTALDLDFSAEQDQVLSPDGDHVIAGKAWTKVNSAQDSVAMAIVNGSGLVIRPVQATAYGHAARTSPILQISLADLIPNYDPAMAVRVEVWNSSNNAAANFDAAVVGVDIGASTVGYAAYRGYNLFQQLFPAVFLNGAGTYGTNVASAFGAANDLIVMDLYHLDALRIVQYYGAGQAVGWPAASTFYRANAVVMSGAPVLVNAANHPYYLVLTAQRNGSGTALAVTYRKVRVLYKA